MNNDFLRGYACCLAAVIRQEGGISSQIRELFKAGLGSLRACHQARLDPEDIDLFTEFRAELEG